MAAVETDGLRTLEQFDARNQTVSTEEGSASNVPKRENIAITPEERAKLIKEAFGLSDVDDK